MVAALRSCFIDTFYLSEYILMEALKVEKINKSQVSQVKGMSAGDHYIFNLCASLYCMFFYIHRLKDPGGDGLEEFFERYPFLSSYYSQVTVYMPEGIGWGDGLQWWRDRIKKAEKNNHISLPLATLADHLGFGSRMALMLTGLVEEDSRFGTVFSELQQPLGYRRPMLETLGYIVLDQQLGQNNNPWTECSPLLSLGLVEAENSQVPRSEWVLRISPGIWDLIKGETNIHKIDFGQRYRNQSKNWKFVSQEKSSSIDSLILDDEFLDRVRGVPALIQSGQAKLIIVRALPGSHSIEVLTAIAKQLRRNILFASFQSEQNNNESIHTDLPSSFGAICNILNAIPILNYDMAPGETVELPELAGYNGPIAIVAGNEGGITGAESEQLINLNMPALDPELRLDIWHQALEKWNIEKPVQLATQFRLPGEYIRQLASMAKTNAKLERRDTVLLLDVQQASRNLNRQMLDSLADHLDAKGSWSHLVAVDTTSEKLIELQQRCTYREQLGTKLGQAFKNSSNCGVRALFTGKSGTGKTLAAKILASELGMDIYRVDLASIINKYIGETEKNLHKVLTRAEALDVILLLDEGDALLGSRTDVKNANDRYANLETNYLLQRLEHYQGIVLVTTNLSDNIDKAFQRRMDIVIPFFQPQMEQRMHIYSLHLPRDHEVEYSYLERAANFCILTGGQIRNVCLHAALLAVDEKRELNQSHLAYALRSEYRKNGGTFPLDVQKDERVPDGGMRSFANALAQQRG